MAILGQEDGFIGSSESFTPPERGIWFTSNYDGLGTSRKVYVTDGNGVSVPYPTGTIDRLIITLSDPRVTNAANAPAVAAYATDIPINDGDIKVTDNVLSAGSVGSMIPGDEVWFQLFNLDGSYHATGKIKVVEVW
ncbi:MAG: hypothetical protein IPM37_23140 [Hahellaceae bacterium]|nr:hypothetical protein [Hahellaceae bacterium]